MKFKIYQMKNNIRMRYVRYTSLETAARKVPDLSLKDYNMVWEGETDTKGEILHSLILEHIVQTFNLNPPLEFVWDIKTRSVSVSNIIELDGVFYYIDPFGFTELTIDDKERIEAKQ